ncbi:AraC family transcriptional regulator [Alkalihalobacillus sp. NPDC078783]
MKVNEEIAVKNNVYVSNVHVKHFKFGSERTYMRNMHSYCMIYMKQGRGYFSINHELVSVRSGDLIILTPGMNVKWDSDKDTLVECVAIFFHCAELSRKNKEWVVTLPTYPILVDPSPDIRLASNGLFYLCTYEKHNLLKVKQVLGQLLYHIKKKAQMTTIRSMEDVKVYMDKHFTDNLAVSFLASYSGYSITQFSKQFKQTYHITPTRYLTEKRMKLAKQLLFSRVKAKDIAAYLGYTDEYYFSRVFKKVEGVAPSLYMKKKNLNIASVYYGFDDHLSVLGLNPVSSLSYKQRVSQSVINNSQHGILIDSVIPNYFKLKDANPDIILASESFIPSTELDHIAPIIILQETKNYQDVLVELASVFGREAQAANWINQFEKRKERVKHLIHESLGNKTVCFIRVGSRGYRMYGEMSQMGHLLYKDLELNPSELITGTHIEFELEELNSSLADYIFIMVDSNDEAHQKMKAFRNSLNKKNQVIEAHDLFYQTLGPRGYQYSMEFIFNRLIEP